MTQIEYQIELIENRFAALSAQFAELSISQENRKTENRFAELSAQIAEFRAQQANNRPENQKTATTVQEKETGELAKTAKDQLNEQLARQETAKDQQTGIARRRKKKPGESRASHEPPLPRIRTTICEGGVEVDGGDIRQGIGIGRLDNDGHRGTITIKRILAGNDVKKDQVSMEELVLPPFKEEHQVRVADDLDSGQGPPSSRKEPAMCGLLTMRGLLAAEHPFTVDDYNASDSNDYDFNYHFKISDMGTIMKDKGLRLALGG